MKTRTITVNIKREPELYAELMRAMNSNTAYNGWHVAMYQEHRDPEGKMVGEFVLREKENGGS